MRLFLGGSKGFVLYEDSEVTNLHSDPVLTAVKPSPNRVIAGTESGSILLYEGNGEARIVAKDLGDEVHGLAVAPNGAIFAGTIPAALWISKDSGERWTELPAFASAPNSENWMAPWGTPLAGAI